MVSTYQHHSFNSLNNAEHLLNFHKKSRWVQPCPRPVEELLIFKSKEIKKGFFGVNVFSYLMSSKKKKQKKDQI